MPSYIEPPFHNWNNCFISSMTIPRDSLEVKRSRGDFFRKFFVTDPKKGHPIPPVLHTRRREAMVYKGFTLCPLTAGLGREYDGENKIRRLS